MAIFIEPNNIVKCLSILEETLQRGSYFIQLGAEKGDHLKVYFTHRSSQEFKKINEKIIQIHDLKEQDKNEEELLFSNYMKGTILMLKHIDSSKDFYYKNAHNGKVLNTFLLSSGYLFLQALKDHSYGFIEKRRVNFSLFLLLLVTSEYTKSSKNLSVFLKYSSNEIVIPEPTIAQLKIVLQEIKEGEVSFWEKEFMLESRKIIDKLGLQYFIDVLSIILDLKIVERDYLKSAYCELLKSVHVKV